MLFRSRSARVTALGFVWILAFTGCAQYDPQSFWEVARTRAVIEGNNFRLLQARVTGSATAKYLFPGLVAFPGALTNQQAPPGAISGIPLTDTALLEKAMRDLHKNIGAPATGKSVFLHNISVEWTLDRVALILYGDYTVTITADVYEYTDEYTNYRTRP